MMHIYSTICSVFAVLLYIYIYNQENAELRQQLQSSEREKTLKEAELTRAEETIRREQQQIQEMRQRVSL